MAASGVFPKSTGDIFYAADANLITMGGPLGSGTVYTGTDLDLAATGTADHVIQLTSSDITNMNYVVANCLYVVLTADAAVQTDTVKLRVRHRETGTIPWTTLLNNEYLSKTTESYHYVTASLNLIIGLSSGEKSNGIDIEFHVTVVKANTAEFRNVQIWFEGRY